MFDAEAAYGVFLRNGMSPSARWFTARSVQYSVGMLSFSMVRSAFCLLLLGTASCPVIVTAQEGESVITIDMQGRRFMPSDVVLPADTRVKLVLLNHDSELHAFVPGALFAGVNMNISGNGFPEFTDAGFRRLIVPPDGRAEIGFVPPRVGDYPFLCDMPGHDMKGTIFVR
jgi:hypothetical protein